MASVWKDPAVELPLDGTTVWITRFPYFATPVQARFIRVAAGFPNLCPIFEIKTPVTPPDEAKRLPWYEVLRWRL